MTANAYRQQSAEVNECGTEAELALTRQYAKITEALVEKVAPVWGVNREHIWGYGSLVNVHQSRLADSGFEVYAGQELTISAVPNQLPVVQIGTPHEYEDYRLSLAHYRRNSSSKTTGPVTMRPYAETLVIDSSPHTDDGVVERAAIVHTKRHDARTNHESYVDARPITPATLEMLQAWLGSDAEVVDQLPTTRFM